MRKVFGLVVLVCGVAVSTLPSFGGENVLAVADRLARAHLSYVYGSEDLRNGGLDCSGFTQIVLREACGVELPNEADKQLDYLHQHGQVWDSTSGWTMETLRPGDLIFYAGPYRLSRTSMVSHVMMYCGHGVMVGAQGLGWQLDGLHGGVGYYRFRPHAPQGILGESGERFLNGRQIFAYGRLSNVVIEPLHDQIVSVPGAITPKVTASRGGSGSSTGTGFELKPFGINSHLD